MPKEKLPLPEIGPSAPPPYEAAISQLNSLTGPRNDAPKIKDLDNKNRNSITGLLTDVIGAGVHRIKETGKYISSKEHKYIQTNNIIQLLSRSSGHSLQILQTPQGQLFLDGLGREGPSSYNSLFTIYKDSFSHKITLHNQFNYIAIINGALTIIQGAQTGPIDQCYFNVREVIGSNSKYVVFESDKEPGRYIAVNSSGKIKSPLTTSYADTEAHFAVRLIVNFMQFIHSYYHSNEIFLWPIFRE
ncbi:unnamed protein product [Gordionus sp. m RMFG-2023]